MADTNGAPSGTIGIDLTAAFGADEAVSTQCFTIYIPNKDRDGKEVGTQRKWVLEAIALLAKLNGGATAMPPVEGIWRSEIGDLIWENPIVVYSYIRPEEFFANLAAIREYLHRMGRETNQGEVAVELDGQFFRITKFDRHEGQP